MQGERITIDKKYVHKIKDENVFLCNLRRVLPLTIGKEIFENDFKNAVNEEEYWSLTCFYRPYVPARGVPAGGAPAEVYAIRYLPAIHFLSPDAYEKLLEETTAAWKKDLLASLYVRETDGQGVYWRIKEDLSEPYDNFLLSSLKAWDLYANYEERTLLSDVLEKAPEMDKKETYFAHMFVNSEHTFFFEHPNEHVPGIMLIEAVRQFVLACGHKYGGVPFQNTQIILNSLDCQFNNYVNINYPVLIKGNATVTKTNRQGFWQHLEIRIEIFQGSKCLSVFMINGNCISSHLFERIRKKQIADLKQSRFIPLRNENYKLELKPERGIRRIEASLVNLSLEGMSVKIKKEDLLPGEKILDIILSYGQNLNIAGRYRKIWHDENDGHVILGLRGLELSEDTLRNLYDLIHRDCMVQEKRESY